MTRGTLLYLSQSMHFSPYFCDCAKSEGTSPVFYYSLYSEEDERTRVAFSNIEEMLAAVKTNGA